MSWLLYRADVEKPEVALGIGHDDDGMTVTIAFNPDRPDLLACDSPKQFRFFNGSASIYIGGRLEPLSFNFPPDGLVERVYRLHRDDTETEVVL